MRGGWPERGERDPTPGAKTPLLYAAREGHVGVASCCSTPARSIEKPDADGVTPLLMAILNDQLAARATLLIERGANVNAADWYGQTPLWAAVDVRNLDVPGPTRDNGVDREAALALIQTLLDARRESERAHERIAAAAPLDHAPRLAVVGRLHRADAVPARRARRRRDGDAAAARRTAPTRTSRRSAAPRR